MPSPRPTIDVRLGDLKRGRVRRLAQIKGLDEILIVVDRVIHARDDIDDMTKHYIVGVCCREKACVFNGESSVLTEVAEDQTQSGLYETHNN